MSSSTKKKKMITAPKHLITFIMPFTGNHEIQICEKLIKLFSSTFLQIEL